MTMRLTPLKSFFGICVLLCAMAYAGFVLIDPPTTASAYTCCAVGTDCSIDYVCCKPDPSCEFPCSTNKEGYCKPKCVRCS